MSLSRKAYSKINGNPYGSYDMIILAVMKIAESLVGHPTCGAFLMPKEGGAAMRIERKWAMPNKWTFLIQPIRNLLNEELTDGLWIDPFAGEHSPASIKNDLNPAHPANYHIDALDFLKKFETASVDGVLFDPPYSPRQVRECYDSIGAGLTWDGRVSFWSDAKNEIARILKPNGKVICFGWNSMGCGKKRGFEMQRILLVPHGGSRNDTICTVEIKTGG